MPVRLCWTLKTRNCVFPFSPYAKARTQIAFAQARLTLPNSAGLGNRKVRLYRLDYVANAS